jgi:hypothetical protein
VAIEDTELGEEKRARRRAAVALGALAVAALLLVVVILILSGRSGDHAATAAGSLPATTQAASTSPPAPTSPLASSSTGPSATATSTPSSSPKPHPRRLPGDPGNVLAAINKLRAQHGVHAIPGAVTAAAVACAAGSGDTSSCPSSYFWEPVTGADGAQVVQKIIAHPSGARFLLDPNMKRVQIGWKSLGNGGWECAVVGGY